MLRTKPPKTTKEIAGRNLDLAEGLVVPSPTHLLNRQHITEVQNEYMSSKPENVKLSKGQPQLWENKEGKVWVPPDQQLHKCLYSVAHQGMSGHRGHAVTLTILKQRLF